MDEIFAGWWTKSHILANYNATYQRQMQGWICTSSSGLPSWTYFITRLLTSIHVMISFSLTKKWKGDCYISWASMFMVDNQVKSNYFHSFLCIRRADYFCIELKLCLIHKKIQSLHSIQEAISDWCWYRVTALHVKSMSFLSLNEHSNIAEESWEVLWI